MSNLFGHRHKFTDAPAHNYQNVSTEDGHRVSFSLKHCAVPGCYAVAFFPQSEYVRTADAFRRDLIATLEMQGFWIEEL